MKTASLFLGMAFLTLTASAQPPAPKKERVVPVAASMQRVRLCDVNELPAPVQKAVGYLPKRLYNKSWTAAAERVCGKNPVLLYEVSAKGPKGQLKAFYNAQGQLDHFTERLKDQPVPTAVMLSLTHGFPGWKLKRAEEQISENTKQCNIVYHLYLSKGKQHRTTFFDKDGRHAQALV